MTLQEVAGTLVYVGWPRRQEENAGCIKVAGAT